MFFVLSKLLLFLIHPFTWILISLYFAFFVKKAAWKKRGRIASIVLILVFSNSFIYLEVMRMWEIHGTRLPDVKKCDVGIVLTGMAEYNNDLKVLSIRRGADRIWQAITLYRAGKIKKLLISGDNGDLVDKGLHEASQFKEVLVKWGIPEQDIIVEPKSRNTYENAVESKKLLDRSYPHYHSFLLITSGRHMRRARACFRHAGMEVETFSTDLYTGPARSYTFDQVVIPDGSTLSDWDGLLKEMVGYVAYAVTGKL